MFPLWNPDIDTVLLKVPTWTRRRGREKEQSSRWFTAFINRTSAKVSSWESFHAKVIRLAQMWFHPKHITVQYKWAIASSVFGSVWEYFCFKFYRYWYQVQFFTFTVSIGKIFIACFCFICRNVGIIYEFTFKILSQNVF